MKKIVDAWINSILLLITLPPRPQPRPSNTTERADNDEQIPDLVPSCKLSPASDKADKAEDVPERQPAEGEPEKPAEREKPAELEKPAEPEKPAEEEKPAEGEKPAEPEKPAEDKKEEEEFRVDKVEKSDEQDVPELNGRPKQRGMEKVVDAYLIQLVCFHSRNKFACGQAYHTGTAEDQTRGARGCTIRSIQGER